MKKTICILLTLACVITSACSVTEQKSSKKHKRESDKHSISKEDDTDDKYDDDDDYEDEKEPEQKYNLAGTEWTTSDDSYMTISDDMVLHWYQSRDELDDNYSAGDVTVYLGDDAFEYLTVDLNDKFGIDADELEQLIERNEKYTMENLICLNIEYFSYMVDGEESIDTANNKTGYWYGFVMNDGAYLDVANMQTGSYYGFSLVE